MIFLCDVVIRVSFCGIISPSVCSSGLAKLDEIVLQKAI